MSTVYVTKLNGQVTRVINMADIMTALKEIYNYDSNEQLVQSGLNVDIVDLINGLVDTGVDVNPVVDALRNAYHYDTIEQLLSSGRAVEITELVRILSQYGFSD